MKEVFTAKNGRPYIKDDNGKVRFISDAEAEEYLMNGNTSNNGKYFIVAVFVILATAMINYQYGVLL